MGLSDRTGVRHPHPEKPGPTALVPTTRPTGKAFVLDVANLHGSPSPGDAQVTRTPAKQLDDLRSPLRFLLSHTQLA